MASLPDPLYLPGFQKFGRRGDPIAATSCCGLRGAAREAEEEYFTFSLKLFIIK